MAIPVQALLIGVDVSKATLAICLGPDQPIQSLDNDRKSIARWLARVCTGRLKQLRLAGSCFSRPDA